MGGLDWTGIGIAVIFGFLAFAVKDMPPAIAWGGVAFGIVLLVWKHLPASAKYGGPLLLAAGAFILCVAAGAWALSVRTPIKQSIVLRRTLKPPLQSHPTYPADPLPKGSGGEGGKATVIGKRSQAFGGPGGRGGPYGHGGKGGDAIVHGDDSVAQGGEGGEAGQAGGKGGRGGRSPAELRDLPNVQLPDGSHLWDYGRGGTGADAKQNQPQSPSGDCGSVTSKDQKGGVTGCNFGTVNQGVEPPHDE
ncbi:MAG: hypothetical protein JO056_11890 [Alphaproteobacteria bacterium]|nr:hypothetical protein [Alphaproteobacteria bacterium]